MNSNQVFSFLNDLKANNNRDWFNENKPLFKTLESDVKDFFKSVQEKLGQVDDIEGHRVMRVYRDVRFSKDKTPYNPRFAGSFKRATAALRGGYFLKIEPGNSIAGGGFYGPNADDLKRIRQEIEMDPSELRELLNAANFKATFGTIQGEKLKTAPRGFDPNHPAIDLIRMKQFYVTHSFSNKEVCSEDFADKIINVYSTIRPFFDYMSSVLTTNLNGESII